jgi:hypothetical protein
VTAEKLAADTWRHLKILGILPWGSTDEDQECAGNFSCCRLPCLPAVVVRLERKGACKTAIKLGGFG